MRKSGAVPSSNVGLSNTDGVPVCTKEGSSF
jgi:hypothetical protein